METFLLVLGALFLLLLGYTAGSLITILLGGRLISDHAEGRFAKREKNEPDEFEAAA